MGVLQFLVLASIFNIHLKLVQLKDLTRDHHVDDISKSISHTHAKRYKSSPARNPLRSTQALQPTFKLGREAEEQYSGIADDLLSAQHSLTSLAEAVINVPLDLSLLSNSNLTTNSSNSPPSVFYPFLGLSPTLHI